MNNSINRGTFMCIGAAVLFGLVPSLLKTLMLGGTSQAVCIMIPNLVSIIVCTALCLLCGWKILPDAKHVCMLLLGGALGLGFTPLLLTSAYQRIPIGTAIVIHFLYPTVVTTMCVILFHKKLTPSLLCAAFLSITGVCFMSLDGSALSGGDVLGYICALVSSLTYALFIIASDRIASPVMSTMSALIWTNLGSLLVGFALLLCGGECVLPSSPLAWSVSIGHGFVELAGFYLLNRGIRSVGAVTASFATLMEPLTAVIFGILFFAEPISAASSAGIVMVLSSVWLNVTSPVQTVSKIMLWMIIMNAAAGKKQGFDERICEDFSTDFSVSVLQKRARPLSFR